MDPLFDILMARELPPHEAYSLWSPKPKPTGMGPPPSMGIGGPPPFPPGSPPPIEAPYINPITLHQMLAKYK